jgi:Dockerin type I domain
MNFQKLITFLLVLVFCTSIAWGAAYQSSKTQSPGISLMVDKDTYLDINQLLCMVHNNGQFAYDDDQIFGKTDGLYFPRGTDKTVIFSAGLWIGAKVNDSLRIAAAEYSSEYTPGPMEGGTFLPDNDDFRVYKITRGDTPGSNPDYANWPSDMGAPVDDYNNPYLLGDQMCWAVYNDADSSKHHNRVGTTQPLGLEIQQSTFAYERSGSIGQLIFIKYLIINEGGNTLEETYISLWNDPDLGDASDDLTGCDTTMSLGFCYNGNNEDNVYGSNPPAVGFDFLQGPIVTGNPGDSAFYKGEWIYGKKNLPMTSFNKYINGTDPKSAMETYNYMQGLLPNGDPVIDDQGDTTMFFVAGDPVTGIGWLDQAAADRRFMMSTGPFTMLPGDTQEVVAAIIVGQGIDRLASITALKENDAYVKRFYYADFEIPAPPSNLTVYPRGLDGAIDLTWSNDVETYYQDFLGSLGEFYIFEGYNIYQGETEEGPWHKIATYDMDEYSSRNTFESAAGENVIECDEYGVCDTVPRPWNFELIYEWIVNHQTGGLELVIAQSGSESGLVNHMLIDEDMINGGSLINDQPYYYAVTPYVINIEDVHSQDSVFAGPNFLGFLSAYIEGMFEPVTAVPKESSGIITDTADHVSGTSDGMVIIEHLDRSSIIPGNYSVGFNPDGTWFLKRDGMYLLDNQTNQSCDYNYEIVDGIMVRVCGPDPGIDGIVEIWNQYGPVDPPDNVFWSLNSTGDWYVSSDRDGSDDYARSRFNWRHHIEWESWEFRFFMVSSEYYDFNTDELWDHEAPFEIWHFTEDASSPDRRNNFAILDDDDSGGWSWGDRIYIMETEYSEPSPQYAEYVWDDDFRLGRVKFNDNGGIYSYPPNGTVVRFNSTKPNTYLDEFQFTIEGAICGDANNDGTVDVSDAIWILNYVFMGGDPPDPMESGDANCDGFVNISDAVWIVNYVFIGGPAPCDTDGDSFPDC